MTVNPSQTTACPVCQTAYFLTGDNFGHRTVCLNCGQNFHLLPKCDDAPTLAVGPECHQEEADSLIGRLWLDLRAGQIVGERYMVVRSLGQGGLSRVFKVKDLMDGSKPAALKLPLAATLDRVPRRVFVDEAVAWLKPAPHPNLVGCKRVIMVMNHPVIIMEFIEGSDLARMMTGAQSHNFYRGRPPGPFSRLMDTFIQVVRGLKYAHGIGLMQLDIKPRNILLESDGRALLSDYGPLSGGLLQKIKQKAGPAANEGQLAPKANPAITNTTGGSVMGTYQYFSPEAINGRPSQGAGADLWALSLTILECFLGYRPWEIGSLAGQGLENYLRTIQQKVPVPPPLANYFRKALADNPLNRHQSTAEVEEELLAVYAEVTKRPYPRPAPEPALENAEQRLARTESLKALGLSSKEAAVLARPALTLVSG